MRRFASTSTGSLLAVALFATGCSVNAPPRIAPTASAPPRFSAGIDSVAAQAVRDLASADFAVRSRAADALVGIGDEALDALGEAGDLTVVVHGRVGVSATDPVVAAILASVGEERLAVHLAAPASNIRRAAALEMGRRGDRDAVPALLARLADGDPRVERAALASLRALRSGAGTAALPRLAAGTVDPVEAASLRAWWERDGHVVASAGRGER